MTKNTNLCVDLKTVMQNDTQLSKGKCYNGILSRTGSDTYLFEEAVHTNTHGHRNPKLYDGKYLSMVRRQDGRYQCYLRQMPDLTQTNCHAYAFGIYEELVKAFTIITTNYQA